MNDKAARITNLEAKLVSLQTKLAEKRKGFGEVVRTRFGDSFEDQLRDDTNLLEAHINTIKKEIKTLKK